MNINKLKNSNLKKFTKMCLLDDLENENANGYITQCLNSTTDVTQFVHYYLSNADERVRLSQTYAIVSKEDQQGHWYRVRNMLGDKVFKTFSDVGGLKVGNDDFSVIIPNGYGDGDTRVAIFTKGETDKFNDHMMKYFTKIEGAINIYAYDCGNEIVKTIEGSYAVYYYDGMIAFEELN